MFQPCFDVNFQGNTITTIKKESSSLEHCRFLALHKDIGVEGGLSPISVKCSSNECQFSVGDLQGYYLSFSN